MIKLKNYWRESSPTIKKLSLWLKSTIGVLALSAYAQSEVRVGFCLLIAGAIIEGILQLLPPDQDAAKAKSAVKEGVVIILILLTSALLLSACKVIKPGVDHSKVDSTSIAYKQVDLHLKGAKVFARLNMDSLYHAALMAKDQRGEDSILRLNTELKYKQDSIAAFRANKPIPPKPVYVPSPPQKQFVTDPETKAQLAYWIDAYGKFQITCESKDQTIHSQQAEITKLTSEKTSEKLLVKETPVWNWIAIAVLGTLLLISLLLNFINRKSN